MPGSSVDLEMLPALIARSMLVARQLVRAGHDCARGANTVKMFLLQVHVLK